MEATVESHPNDLVLVNKSKTSDNEYNFLKEQINRQKMLLELGQIITSEMNLEALFELIIRQTNIFMNTEQCSVFMFDEKSEAMWSLVSTDLKRNEIRIPANQGVTGWVFQNETPLIINDAYHDPRFCPEVDRKTGFRTRNILCIPIINREKKCIGTLQTLNKKTGNFNEQDQEMLVSASHYVAIALENAKLYEDLKLLDKAKEKVTNHLSHELKTPLAIIFAVLKKIQEKMGSAKISGLDKTLDRGLRNLRRLMDLQEKIDDILAQRSIEEKERILDIIESAASLLSELGEEHQTQYAEMAELLSERLESLFSKNEPIMEEISVSQFLEDLTNRTLYSMGDRELNLVQDFAGSLNLFMDRTVLQKVCEGLLKNAIENTPDEGKIVLTARKRDEEIQISFHDFGVGITSQNQRMIFGGFFHTQDTNLYSTKRPYEFGAGGTGSDLLRIKCLSEKYGFDVDFKSTRCRYIPGDTDVCPGRISRCKFISKASECLSSGESTFMVKFKQDKFCSEFRGSAEH